MTLALSLLLPASFVLLVLGSAVLAAGLVLRGQSAGSIPEDDGLTAQSPTAATSALPPDLMVALEALPGTVQGLCGVMQSTQDAERRLLAAWMLEAAQAATGQRSAAIQSLRAACSDVATLQADAPLDAERLRSLTAALERAKAALGARDGGQ